MVELIFFIDQIVNDRKLVNYYIISELFGQLANFWNGKFLGGIKNNETWVIFLFKNWFLYFLKLYCKIKEICYFFIRKWWSFRNLTISFKKINSNIRSFELSEN